MLKKNILNFVYLVLKLVHLNFLIFLLKKFVLINGL
jgi:hypothetical protein